MAGFDAVARISLDLRAFAAGANQVTRAGGQMERVFKNLEGVLNKITPVEKKQAAELQRTLRIYNQVTSAAKNYVAMINALSKAETSSANATKLMEKAFAGLRNSLSAVRGIGQKEFERVQRTLILYNQMANVIKTLATAQNQMAQATQRGVQATAAEAKEADRAKKARTDQAIAEQRLATAEQRTAVTTAQAAAAQSRATSAANAAATSYIRLSSAQERAAASQRNLNNQLRGGSGGNILRQDLSELSTAYSRLQQIATTSISAVVGAAISHESAFAQLARVTKVTGQEAENLKRAFEGLATTEPISFEEVTRIGQLAAQTGVATHQLEEFTRTVVRFSITTGITSDQVAVLFGRIQNMQNLPTSQMSRFASMVLAVGTASAATEDEILKVTQAISTSSKAFGLGTTDVGGLAGALASLRVPPEWARGTTTRIFRELDDAVKGAGAELGILTDVMGLTSDEIQELRASDPGEFFRRFIQGMQKFTDTSKSAEEQTASVANVLRSLGVNAVRDIEFISRLATNFDTLASQTEIASVSFAKNSELTEQTAILYDTARVKIDNMIDAFGTFLAGVGKDIVIVLGDAASAVQGLIEGFGRVPDSVKTLATVTSVIIGFTAAIAAARAAAFLLLRTFVSMRETSARLGIQQLTLTNTIRAYRQEQASAAAATDRSRQSIIASARAAVQENAARRASVSALNEQARAAVIAANRQQQLSLRGIQLARQELQLIGQRAASGRTLSDDANRQIAAQQRLTASTQRYQQATQTALAGTQRLAAVGGTATSGLAARMGAVTVATRAAAGAVSLLGAAFASIAIGAIITGIFAIVEAMKETTSASQQAADAAFEASGGILALGEAIRADTAAAAAGETPIRTLTTSVEALSAADREAAESKRANAQAEQQRIEALFGSIDALRNQAKGTGQSAKSAREYVLEWDAAQKIIEQVNVALGQNQAALGKSSQAMLESTVRQAVMTDAAFKTSEGLNAITNSSLSIQKALDVALKDPAQAARILQGEIDKLNEKFAEVQVGGPTNLTTEEFAKQIKSFQQQKLALETLRDTVGKFTGSLGQAAAADKLFGGSAKQAGADAEDMGEGMDDASSSAASLGADILAMSSALSSALDPMRSLEVAFQSINFDSAKEFAEAFRAGEVSVESLHKSFNAFTADLVNQITATRDWQANLVRAVNELTPEVANAFRDMGIEAAPLLAQALELKGPEREKFIAQMETFGKSGQEAFATAVTKGQDAIKGKGTETGELFANATADAIDKAMKPGGSVAQATGGLQVLAEAISRGAITKEVALDLTKFRGDADKLESLILDLVQSGKLDIKAAASLATTLFTGEATELSNWVRDRVTAKEFDVNGNAILDDEVFFQHLAALEAQANRVNTERTLRVQGQASLSDEQYQEELKKLETLVTVTVASGTLDPEGDAKLTPEGFIATMDSLETLAKARGDQGDFDANGDGKLDPKEYQRVLAFLKGLAKAPSTTNSISPQGKATLNPDAFNSMLGTLKRNSQTWELEAEKLLRPSASVNQSTFNTNLQTMRVNSFNTGQTIQANLTKTATVTVGYTYKQNNSPPKTANIATGGMVRGPGTGTSDSIPAMLSNGEFVVRAKQAAKYGALLQAINSGRQKTVRAFANGGTVGSFNVQQATLNLRQTRGIIQQMPANSQIARVVSVAGNTGMQITINNSYPQAEPTSVTINRSLAYAASLNGVG